MSTTFTIWDAALEEAEFLTQETKESHIVIWDGDSFKVLVNCNKYRGILIERTIYIKR